MIFRDLCRICRRLLQNGLALIVCIVLHLALTTEGQVSWTQVHACRKIEGQLTLRCPANQRIMIFSANYGNSSGYNCSTRFKPRSPQTWTNGTGDSANLTMSSSLSNVFLHKPWCNHDMTSFVKDLCSGRDVCLIEIEDSIFRSPCDGNEALDVKYACIPASQVISVCNRNLSSPDGHILSPGYPEYYPGPSDCSWRITTEVGKNILIMLNDLSLRPQSAKDNFCKDYLIIYEENRQLVKTCHSYPFNLQIASNIAKISLISNSRGWTSKGVWIFYKAIGCSNPYLPELVSQVGRNYTTARLKCQEGFVFHDKDHPFDEMVLNCIDGQKWDRSVPNCSNDSEWKKAALANLDRRGNTPVASLNGVTLQEIVIPSTVAGVVLLIIIAILGIVLSLRRHKRRGIVYHHEEIQGLNRHHDNMHVVRKAPRAQIDSATDLAGSYPLTEIRD